MKTVEQKTQEVIPKIRHEGFLVICGQCGLVPTPYFEECYIKRTGVFYISPEQDPKMLDVLSHT